MKNMLLVYGKADKYKTSLLIPVESINAEYTLQIPWQSGHSVTVQLKYEQHPTDSTLNRLYVSRIAASGAWATVAPYLEVWTF